MRTAYEIGIAITLQAVLSLILSVFGYWYLQFVTAAVLGLILNFGLLTSASLGVGGIVGTLISVFLRNGMLSLTYASLAGQIMGLGSFLPLLFMLLILSFIISWAGGMIGSAFTLPFTHEEKKPS